MKTLLIAALFLLAGCSAEPPQNSTVPTIITSYCGVLVEC